MKLLLSALVVVDLLVAAAAAADQLFSVDFNKETTIRLKSRGNFCL